jgi:phenylpropionate dioxygenase-like ring-hydroxylating dioxygenase large terminal subunit
MRGLSNRFYTDSAHFEFERDELFAKTWACVGFGSDVPAAGDLVPVSLLGIPLILLRDRQGKLKVFHNVCSHRGMRLVDKPARCDTVIRCPYHSWAYDLDGALKATPKFGGPDSNSLNGFDRSAHGLREVRSAVWFDTVFVNVSGNAPSFEDHIQPLRERWRMFDESLIRHSGKDSSLKLSVNCNWKLAVENYCESYHLPWVHPGLNSYSKLEDHYNIIEDSTFAGQGSRAYKPALTADGLELPTFPDLPPAWRGAAEYVALFPNLLIGVHQDHVKAVRIEPVSAERTVEHMEIFYVGEAAMTDRYREVRAANLAAWCQVFQEDVFAVEGMQAGRRSPAFDGGLFSPVMDAATHCFHRWTAGRYGAAGRSRFAEN